MVTGTVQGVRQMRNMKLREKETSVLSISKLRITLIKKLKNKGNGSSIENSNLCEKKRLIT